MRFVTLFFLLCSIAYSQTYVRSEWGGGWIDADKDCLNTRQEVLIEESLIPVALSEDGCRVLSGLWLCIYTGKIFTDPSQLEIDHLVPLENAFYAGGYLWGATKKKEYANFLADRFHLVAVYKSANRSKQGRSPDQWMPPYEASRCAYLKMWVDVKEQWGLAMTTDEEIFIENYSNQYCN